MTKQRHMSMATRKELTEAVGARYRAASRAEKQRILEEFVALIGCHRKHAIRVLGLGRTPGQEHGKVARNRIYDEATAEAVRMLWEAADRVCGKRLKALIPVLIDAMERHGHLDLDPIIKEKVLAISAATIDRLLAGIRAQIDGQRKRRKGIGAAIRRSIPVRTSPTGVTHHPASLRWTWSSTTAARRPMVTTCTHSCSPTSPVGGPSAFRCATAARHWRGA